MKVKCRKAAATLLCCLLAFLSVAAELSHHHGLPPLPGSVRALDAPQSESGDSLGAIHGYNCVACHFTATQLAVVLAVVLLPSSTPTVFLAVSAPQFTTQFFFQLASLRAPPAVFA